MPDRFGNVEHLIRLGEVQEGGPPMREFMPQIPSVYPNRERERQVIDQMIMAAQNYYLDELADRLKLIEDAHRQFNKDWSEDVVPDDAMTRKQLEEWVAKALGITATFRQAEVDYRNKYEPF